MAPAKLSRETKTRTVITKSTINDQNIGPMKKGGKRKADSSPVYEKVKRSALGNLTNAVINAKEIGDKKIKLGTGTIQGRKVVNGVLTNVANKFVNNTTTSVASLQLSNVVAPQKKTTKGFQVPQIAVPKLPGAAATRPTKVLTRAAARANQPIDTTIIKKEIVPNLEVVQKPTRRISNEFEKSKTLDDTLYMSALDSW